MITYDPYTLLFDWTDPDPLNIVSKSLGVYIVEIQEALNVFRDDAGIPRITFKKSGQGSYTTTVPIQIKKDITDELKQYTNLIAMSYGISAGVVAPELLGRDFSPYGEKYGKPLFSYNFLNDIREVINKLRAFRAAGINRPWPGIGPGGSERWSPPETVSQSFNETYPLDTDITSSEVTNLGKITGDWSSRGDWAGHMFISARRGQKNGAIAGEPFVIGNISKSIGSITGYSKAGTSGSSPEISALALMSSSSGIASSIVFKGPMKLPKNVRFRFNNFSANTSLHLSGSYMWLVADVFIKISIKYESSGIDVVSKTFLIHSDGSVKKNPANLPILILPSARTYFVIINIKARAFASIASDFWYHSGLVHHEDYYYNHYHGGSASGDAEASFSAGEIEIIDTDA